MTIKLIDIQTLSNMLSVKPKTIYDWVRKSEIPYFKIGSLIRFDPDKIKRWLTERSKEPKNLRL